MAPPQLGAPGAPGRLGPRCFPPPTPPVSGTAAACTRSSPVPRTRAPARVQDRRGVRHSQGQPGPRAPRPREVPAGAAARSPSPGPAPRAPRSVGCRVGGPPGSYRPVRYHAAVRGSGKRRGENGGRDRPGRGFYQVSDRVRKGGRVAEPQAQPRPSPQSRGRLLKPPLRPRDLLK